MTITDTHIEIEIGTNNGFDSLFLEIPKDVETRPSQIWKDDVLAKLDDDQINRIKSEGGSPDVYEIDGISWVLLLPREVRELTPSK